MAKVLRTILVVLSTITARVLSQSSNVTHCIPEYQWSINSRGQTPCLVGAYLGSLCSGIPVTVSPLPPGNHYLGPDSKQADPCHCNSVIYSVISACGGCQNRSFIDYATWTLACPSLIEIGQFPRPFPDTIEVPSWASLNISLTNNSFNALAAEEEAERANASPSATSSAPPATSSQTSTTITGLPGPSLPPASSSTSPSSDSDSGGLSPGGIAGVTIGSLAVVIIILLLVFWAMLRARRRRNAKPGSLDEPFSPMEDRPQAPMFLLMQHVHARSLSDPASVITPYTYSASDQQPVSPGASTYYTTAPGRGSFEDINNPRTMLNMQNTSAGPRGYTGAAEV